MSFNDPATAQSLIGGWTNFTPTLTNISMGNGSVNFKYRREGDSVRIRGVFYFGSTTSVTGTITFGLPAGLTIATSRAPAGGYDRCGYATCYQGAGNREVYAVNSTPSGAFTVEGIRNDGVSGLFNASFPAAWANGHQLFIEDLLVPITEWGTNVNLTSDFQEFASNSSSADGDDLTSFVSGPDGSQGIIGATTLSARCRKRVRFKNAIKPTDKFVIEIFNGSNWHDLGHGINFDNGTCVAAFAPAQFIGSTTTSGFSGGMSYQIVNSTDVDVWFGRSCIIITDQSAVVPWSHASVLPNQKWRLRKISNGNFAENVFQGQVSNWIPFTPVWTSDGTQPSLGNGTIQGYYCRVGAMAVVRIGIGFGSTTTYGTGNYQFSLPPGLSSSSKGEAGSVGSWNSWNPGATGFQSGPVVIGVSSMGGASSTRVSLCRDGNVAGFVGATNPYTYANTGWIHLEFMVDINEWTANINLAEDFTEFLSCDGTAGVAANTSYTPTTSKDAAGSSFPNVTISSTTATTTTSYTLTPQVALKPTDVLILELNSGNGWVSAASLSDNAIGKGVVQGTTPMGWTMGVVAGGLIKINFSNAGRTPSATYGTAQSDWGAAISTWKWRVRKISNGNFAQAGSDIYSTAETLTNKVWINGKPIYRKVVALGTLPSSTSKSVAHGITGITECWIEKAFATNGTTRVPLPTANPTAVANCVYIDCDATNVTVITGIPGWSSYTGYAVLEYTK